MLFNGICTLYWGSGSSCIWWNYVKCNDFYHIQWKHAVSIDVFSRSLQGNVTKILMITIFQIGVKGVLIVQCAGNSLVWKIQKGSLLVLFTFSFLSLEHPSSYSVILVLSVCNYLPALDGMTAKNCLRLWNMKGV